MSLRLPRLQLFEINDAAWAPRALRDTVVESLSRTLDWGRMLHDLVPPFEAFLAAGAIDEVLDLGSGGGGPARILARAIARRGGAPPKIVLTDLHPQTAAWQTARAAHPGVIDFVSEPVDASAIPDDVAAGRARMIINVLHHFPPRLAAALLEDAVRGGRGVFVSEAFDRNPLAFANFAVAGLPALAINPLVSPRDRAMKALLTYATPAALAAALWDGLVSTLRVYTEQELRAMVAPFGQAWRWTYGTYRYFPLGAGYFFYGVPDR